jgi:hypothetical protein
MGHLPDWQREDPLTLASLGRQCNPSMQMDKVELGPCCISITLPLLTTVFPIGIQALTNPFSPTVISGILSEDNGVDGA